MKITEMDKNELLSQKKQWEDEYNSFKAQGLKLNMARGKPSPEQLDFSMDMLEVLDSKTDFVGENGDDYRNYGLLGGIPEAKKFFSKMIGVSEKEILVCGNASLNIMYDVISTAYAKGLMGNKPWCRYDKVKFLCPVPGYDRHFAICESFGIEMINIPTTESGPDMDMVEKLVSEDETVKGIWCVPQYTNPTGYVYSDETVKRFAALKPKAKDFRIFWDNAYCIHHLVENPRICLNILDECKKTGNEDMPFIFGSTSKITFPGAGVAVMGASEANIADLMKVMGIRTIGYDKTNQLRHVKYFGCFENMLKHMDKHKTSILPKFEAVLNALDKNIAPLEAGTWSKPDGGYFVSFDALPGCAKRIVALCKEAGVTLTGAGAAFPYGKDPEDKNIRIAPTYPTVDELKTAMEIFCLAVKIASAEKVLEG